MIERLNSNALMGLTVDEMNAGPRCYRPDLRYSREDALHYVTLWNAHKISTVACVITVDGIPQVMVVPT